MTSVTVRLHDRCLDGSPPHRSPVVSAAGPAVSAWRLATSNASRKDPAARHTVPGDFAGGGARLTGALPGLLCRAARPCIPRSRHRTR